MPSLCLFRVTGTPSRPTLFVCLLTGRKFSHEWSCVRPLPDLASEGAPLPSRQDSKSHVCTAHLLMSKARWAPLGLAVCAAGMFRVPGHTEDMQTLSGRGSLQEERLPVVGSQGVRGSNPEEWIRRGKHECLLSFLWYWFDALKCVHRRNRFSALDSLYFAKSSESCFWTKRGDPNLILDTYNDYTYTLYI